MPEASIVLQFQSDAGETAGACHPYCWQAAAADGGPAEGRSRPGPQLAVPQSTTPEQLETLLNGLLSEEGRRLPYLFYVQDRPLGSSLGEHLLQHQVQRCTLRGRAPRSHVCRMTGRACRCLWRRRSPSSTSRRPSSGSGQSLAVRHRCQARPLPRPRRAPRCHQSRFSRVCRCERILSPRRPGCLCVTACVRAGHAEAVLCVAFSPDGANLGSGSGDSTVRLWDLSTSTPRHTCQARRTACCAVVLGQAPWWSCGSMWVRGPSGSRGSWHKGCEQLLRRIPWAAQPPRRCRGTQRGCSAWLGAPMHGSWPAGTWQASSGSGTLPAAALWAPAKVLPGRQKHGRLPDLTSVSPRSSAAARAAKILAGLVLVLSSQGLADAAPVCPHTGAGAVLAAHVLPAVQGTPSGSPASPGSQRTGSCPAGALPAAQKTLLSRCQRQHVCAA